MSRLMMVLGILLAALGIVIGIFAFASPGRMQIYGLTLDTGVLLLVGGVLAFGLGALIGTVDKMTGRAVMPAQNAPQPKTSATMTADEQPAAIPGFGRKGAGAATAAAVGTIAGAVGEQMATTRPPAPSVAETISALEQAKTDIKNAMGGMDAEPVPADIALPVITPPAATQFAGEEPAADPAADAEGEAGLYVLEEKMIRGRPARVLSDETVEAETDEGWMRFENLEHLNEYLDSIEEPV